VAAVYDRRILDNGGAHRAPLQAKTKTPSDPGKTENEGIQRILAKTVRQAGLILLFDGEVDPAPAGPDEHSQTGILTSASNRLPAFPIRFGGTLGNL